MDSLHAVFSRAPIIVWAVDGDGRFTLAVGRVSQLGWEPDELVGQSVFDLYRDAPAITEAHRRALAGETVSRRVEVGGRIYQAEYLPIVAEDGGVEGVIGLATDLTEYSRAERGLLESERKYRQLVETSNDLIWAIDRQARFTFVNAAVRHTHGYEPEAVLGRQVRKFVHPEHLELDQAVLERILAGRPEFRHETRHLRRDGSSVWLSLNAVPLIDDSGTVVGATGTAADISERRRMETELRRLADNDALTGLFNRRRFEEELDREIAARGRYLGDAAVLVIDLDNFKFVNDTHGHPVGDELIVAVAGLLRRRLRDSDIRARLGGDEFAVLMPFSTTDEARAAAENLREGLRDPLLTISGRPIRTTASFGITAIGGRAVTGKELLGEADVAMYEAKDAGRDRVAVYSPERQVKMRQHATWADRIRAALDGDGFALEAQPIVDLAAGEVSQYELLVRMRGEDGELVLPGSFISTAERFGLIQPIDRWVVTQAIGLIAQHAAAGRRIQIEVNLSGKSFDDRELLDFLERSVRDSGIDPSALMFEITETEAIASLEEAREFALRLKELGCYFALDDFGAGFGSFYYLKYLPLDYVKIDGDFIRDVTRSHSDRLMVKAMVDVARGMGMRTVAEFVESEEILAAVRELGVDFAQGFHVARPGPLPLV